MDRLRPCACKSVIRIPICAAANVVYADTSGCGSSGAAAREAGGKALDILRGERLHLYILFRRYRSTIRDIGTRRVLLHIDKNTCTDTRRFSCRQGGSKCCTRRRILCLYYDRLACCSSFLLGLILVHLCSLANPGLRICNADIQSQGTRTAAASCGHTKSGSNIQRLIRMHGLHGHALCCIHDSFVIDIGLRFILRHTGIHSRAHTGILRNGRTAGCCIDMILRLCLNVQSPAGLNHRFFANRSRNRILQHIRIHRACYSLLLR